MRLVHWWRMLVEPKGMGRIRGLGPAGWQVLYNDGEQSAPMAYDEACNYAAIFGGTVRRMTARQKARK